MVESGVSQVPLAQRVSMIEEQDKIEAKNEKQDSKVEIPKSERVEEEEIEMESSKVVRKWQSGKDSMMSHCSTSFLNDPRTWVRKVTALDWRNQSSKLKTKISTFLKIFWKQRRSC